MSPLTSLCLKSVCDLLSWFILASVFESLGNFSCFLRKILYLFTSCSSAQSWMQACIRRLLYWTVAVTFLHTRVALLNSRVYAWKQGFFRIGFVCPSLCVFPVSVWTFFMNAIWIVCVPLLITLCAFLKALESLLLGLFSVCIAEVVGLFGLWNNVSLSRSVIRVLGSVFLVCLLIVAGCHLPL